MSSENANRMLISHVIYLTTIALLILILPSELKGAPNTDIAPNTRNQKEKAALKACLAGDMKGGIELLAELYADTHDSTYIYNQARCYQQNNEPELALNRFREYLRKGPELSQKEKEALDRNMDECQKLIAERRATMGGGTTAVASEHTNLNQEKAASTIPLVAEGNLADGDHSTPGRHLRIAGITTFACGVASLGVGLIYWKMRDNILGDVDDQRYMTDQQSKHLGTYKTISLIGYGLGSAAVVTGVTLYLLGNHQAGAEPSVALLPSFLQGEANLTLRGRF